MSNRLDKEREAQLQPQRMKYALDALTALGIEPSYQDETRLEFAWKGKVVKLYPYPGWHTGGSIQDGRGIEKLLKQLKINNE